MARFSFEKNVPIKIILTLAKNGIQNQGDQIGQIFAYWAMGAASFSKIIETEKKF
jgi:hypothetical protein